MPSYIRVAANISDPYSRAEAYAVAFKTSYYDDKLDELKTKLEQKLASGNMAPLAKMFEPATLASETNIGESKAMIAFLDTVFADDNINISPVEYETGGVAVTPYHVYIFAKNDSGYGFIQPSSVSVTN
jgi:hypothetical protein